MFVWVSPNLSLKNWHFDGYTHFDLSIDFFFRLLLLSAVCCRIDQSMQCSNQTIANELQFRFRFEFSLVQVSLPVVRCLLDGKICVCYGIASNNFTVTAYINCVDFEFVIISNAHLYLVNDYSLSRYHFVHEAGHTCLVCKRPLANDSFVRFTHQTQ